MHILILMLALTTLAACKSDNQILGRPFVAATEEKGEKKVETKEEIKLSTRPDQVIAYEKNQSVLRDKLMSLLINVHLEKKSVKTSPVTVVIEEEYKLKNKAFSLTNVEQEDYILRSKEQARVVISYSDHILVFFIPAGINVNNIEEKLGLKAEQNKALLVMGKTEGKTFAGQVIYILSSDRQEIVDYDLQTYSENTFYGTFSENLNLMRLQKSQKVEAIITYEYFTQDLIDQMFSGQGLDVHGDAVTCTWSQKTPGANMQRTNPATIEDLGLAVKINSTLKNFNEMRAQVMSPNEISLHFSSSEENNQSYYDVSVSFAPRNLTLTLELGMQQHRHYCWSSPTGQFAPYVVTYKARTQANLKLITKGHGDLLNDLKL